MGLMSWFFYLLGDKTWAKNVTVNLFGQIYMSEAVRNSSAAWKILAHELVHSAQRKELGNWNFLTLYFSPQFVGVLSLLIVLPFAVGLSLFGDTWWPFVALGIPILFLPPWPSPDRVTLEVEAYAVNLWLNQLRYGGIKQDSYTWVISSLTGPTYYWAARSNQATTEQLQKLLDAQITLIGLISSTEEPYASIKKVALME